MSTYGFRAYNDANQVLISSDLENLHYGGKATYGGLASSMAEYGGHQIHTYTFTTTGLPLVFIKPIFYDRFYAVLTHKQVGSLWTFDVIHSGTTDAHPDLHIFVTPKDLSAPTEQYGMQVFLENGDPSFDSRLSPLSISGGGVCRPTTCPPNDGCTPNSERQTDWNYNVLDWDFNTDQSFNAYALNGLVHTDLMFASPSLAQSAWIRRYYGEKCSDKPYPQSGCQKHESWVSWGVFYRNAFRLTSTTFDAGWIPLAHNYFFSSQYDDGGWFGGGGGSSTVGAPMPFVQKTINLVDNAYILADVRLYE